ncbi:MAG TPA: RNA polymerase factor sigma-54 [Spirochaetota bacterium]|nr:RNA polymerase factor sigma-54 [Spirochaetota bacterium]HOS41057.1 RNA polymerase factor sigma-54 [Spirochaetota bacterium]HPI23326.1 RNA polymerase factor sigma-54 [Spirochaetota bacterium]HPU89016.1 RNA polymerase factor sigma-54 [Spirochaetota bacterium]
MAQSPRLELRQSQKLFLTQTLRQSIEMLQLSTVELMEMIRAELTENPVLEETSSEGAATVGSADDREGLLERSLSGDEAPAGEKGEGTIEYERYGDSAYSGHVDDDSNRRFIENTIRYGESLQDVLLRQARIVARDIAEEDLFERIITALDENGFVRLSPGEIAEGAGVPIEAVVHAMGVIQEFDPPGCATTGAREALLVQARAQYPNDALLAEIIERHFDDLDNVRFERIAKALGVEIGAVMDRVEKLHHLDPFPGRQFSRQGARYIVPDVEARLDGGELAVTMKDDWLPDIDINSYYSRLLDEKKIEKKHKEYIQDKLQSARNLIKNIRTRRTTIARVVGAVMERQRAFLDRGPGHLRPLTCREIADDLGYHESTVSRAMSNKFVQTAWGIFEMRSFFVSRVGNEGVEAASSDRVQALIRETIAGEDPSAPLSDEDICERIREQGIHPSRRTVAKYRGELNIPPAHTRKRIHIYKTGEHS